MGLISKLIGRIVLQAQDTDFSKYKITEDILTNLNIKGLTFQKYVVDTPDGEKLDTFEAIHDSQKHLPAAEQKYIINFAGNGMCYELIAGGFVFDIQRDAKDLKVNVIGFNYRGVGESTGRTKSKDDLVADGIAQVQRLLDKGVLPKNIILKGHSLGGGVATLVAAHFHQQEKTINLFNSRSFSSITNHVVGIIRLLGSDGQNETAIGKVLGWLAWPIVKLVLVATNWEMNAGKAFKTIPEEHRDYIVVRSEKGQKINRTDDGVIPYYASIHKALTSERREKKAAIEDPIEKKKYSNDRKMTTGSTYASDGHNASWRGLHNQSLTTAHDFFGAFVHRVVPENVPETIALDI